MGQPGSSSEIAIVVSNGSYRGNVFFRADYLLLTQRRRRRGQSTVTAAAAADRAGHFDRVSISKARSTEWLNRIARLI